MHQLKSYQFLTGVNLSQVGVNIETANTASDKGIPDFQLVRI